MIFSKLRDGDRGLWAPLRRLDGRPMREQPPSWGESVPDGVSAVGLALLLSGTPVAADTQPGHGPCLRYRPFLA